MGSTSLSGVTPTPLVDDSFVARQLQVLDLDGRVTARVEIEGKLGPVDWSPDGRHIALIGSVDRNDPAAGRLQLVSVEGGAPRDLLPDLEAHVATFDWQDPNTLAYVADYRNGDGGRNRLARRCRVLRTDAVACRPAGRFRPRHRKPGDRRGRCADAQTPG